MATSRDDIIEKIRALRAKAADAAATEAEAMTAAEMAARLLTKHDIRPEELAEVAKSEGHVSGFRQGKVLHPVANRVCNAVAALTETTGYNDNGEIKFVGLEEDVMMAVYLIEMLVGAAKRAWIAHAEENYEHVTKKNVLDNYRASYFEGFATRVYHRLMSLKAQRDTSRAEAQGSSNSSALVIVKSEVIKRKMEEMGLKLYKRRAKKEYYDPRAMAAGMAQGDRVNLNRPFAGNGSMGQLA